MFFDLVFLFVFRLFFLVFISDGFDLVRVIDEVDHCVQQVVDGQLFTLEVEVVELFVETVGGGCGFGLCFLELYTVAG